jgi:hypothetical protein
MTEDTKLIISYGRRNYPDDVRAVWGARLIWPDDLLWDRQDIAAHDEESKAALTAWLNGPNRGDGALKAMKEALATPYTLGLASDKDDEAVIYEDDKGKIIGSAQSSFGYLYVCAWLKEHVS